MTAASSVPTDGSTRGPGAGARRRQPARADLGRTLVLTDGENVNARYRERALAGESIERAVAVLQQTMMMS